MTEFKTPSTFSRITRQQQVSVSSGGTFELCWEVLHPDVTKRRASDGQAVKQNSVVVIKHCQTNQNLSSDKVGYTNSFGTECEVCGNTALTRASKHGQEEPLPVNCWAVVSAPTGAHYEEILDASFKDSDTTLERVKAKFWQRAGTGGFRTLARILKTLDDNGNRQLDCAEMQSGLATYGIRLTDQEAKAVMRAFDKDGSGQVSITEFLRSLRGPMNHRRRTLVSEAYRRFDKNYDGTVNLADLKLAYGKHIHRHPSVVSGEKTPEQVLLEFATAWDKNGDGTITEDEFLEYYTDVSVNIDDDNYFELMLRNAWHMSGGSGWSENTTCRRVLVTYTDGYQSVEEIKDDLGLDSNDIEGMRQRLIAQGVRNIKDIQPYG
jgi:Ca2+-binding EF-hand superfamily protein